MSGVGAPRKRRRWIWWVVLAVVVAVAGAFVASGLMTTSTTDSGYTTGQVQRTLLTATVSGSGNLAVAGVTAVQPGITGTVEDLSVKLGDRVKVDQLLFRIVNTDLDATVTRAEASYEQSRQQVQQANASLIQARNNLYSVQHPSSPGTAPPKPVDARAVKLAKKQVTVACIGITSAGRNLDSASIALKQARDDADKRRVTAPVSGVVTALSAQNGQSLGSGGSSSGGSAGTGASASGAVEISDLKTLRARVQVNEVDLVSVKLGQKASVQFDALPDGDASGTVTAISPTGTNTQGVVTYDVDLTLSRIDKRLRPGMSCTVEIVTQVKDGALVVPTSALRTDTATSQKYVVVVSTQDQSTRNVPVTTGLVVGTTTEILSGVTEGQVVVTTPGTSTNATGSGNQRNGGGGGVLRMFGGGRG